MSDKEALAIFSRQRVSQDMVNFLVSTTNSIIQVKPSKPDNNSYRQRLTKQPVIITPYSPTISLTEFIHNLIKYSNVQTPTLMATLVYLNKLRNLLPANSIGMETTRHRIFLSALILAAKSLNDSSPLNKHWMKYTDGLLSQSEINMAERELLALLKWNINIKHKELIIALQPFLEPIKQSLQRQRELESTQRTNYYKLSQAQSRSNWSVRTGSSSASSSYSIASNLSLGRDMPHSISSNSIISVPESEEEQTQQEVIQKRMPLSNRSLNMMYKQQPPVKMKRSTQSFNLLSSRVY
ncbi:PHO85 cyclin-2 [Spathaspora sp. JA1]|nr:PHO85 cyclin-2 [Spathaspora sp. JA1]